MREFGLDDEDGVGSSFADVESIATGCRFRDCAHASEPGCAVQEAARDGVLAADRVQAYMKLGREAAHAERRHDALARIAERRRWKVIQKSVHAQMRERYGDAR